MTTPYERLMAEAIPTGRFGRPDGSRAAMTPAATSTSEQQAARRAALEEAQHGWRLPDPDSERKRQRSAQVAAEKAREREQSRPRHLRIVPDPNDTRAA